MAECVAWQRSNLPPNTRTNRIRTDGQMADSAARQLTPRHPPDVFQLCRRLSFPLSHQTLSILMCLRERSIFSFQSVRRT